MWTLLTYEEHNSLAFLLKHSSTFLFGLFFFFKRKTPPQKSRGVPAADHKDIQKLHSNKLNSTLCLSKDLSPG